MNYVGRLWHKKPKFSRKNLSLSRYMVELYIILSHEMFENVSLYSSYVCLNFSAQMYYLRSLSIKKKVGKLDFWTQIIQVLYVEMSVKKGSKFTVILSLFFSKKFD